MFEKWQLTAVLDSIAFGWLRQTDTVHCTLYSAVQTIVNMFFISNIKIYVDALTLRHVFTFRCAEGAFISYDVSGFAAL